MEQNIVIKDFNDFDTGALYAIIRHVYLTSDFMSDDFDRRFGNFSRFSAYLNDILGHPGSFLLVALCENRPVGYLLLEPRSEIKLQHTAWLTMGMVEDCRRKGIGSQLVEAALHRAGQEAVVEIIYLMVRADHTGALRLYQKTGFETVAILERDTKIGDEYYDGVMMRKFVG